MKKPPGIRRAVFPLCGKLSLSFCRQLPATNGAAFSIRRRPLSAGLPACIHTPGLPQPAFPQFQNEIRIFKISPVRLRPV